MNQATIKLGVNIKLDEIEENISILHKHNLDCEIYILGEHLDEFLQERLEVIGERLREKGTFLTVHGPFTDLNPGFSDSLLREAVIRRFQHAIDFAYALGANSIVLHSGFVPLKSEKKFKKWFQNSLRTWEKVLSYAKQKNIIVAIENIFDDSPGTLRRILDFFNSPYLKHCFDIGHFNLFVKEIFVSEWIDIFADHLYEIHLHDNRGQKDEHLPLGGGNIDWSALFKKVFTLRKPPFLVLENHCYKDLELSVNFLKRKYSTYFPQVLP